MIQMHSALEIFRSKLLIRHRIICMHDLTMNCAVARRLRPTRSRQVTRKSVVCLAVAQWPSAAIGPAVWQQRNFCPDFPALLQHISETETA